MASESTIDRPDDVPMQPFRHGDSYGCIPPAVAHDGSVSQTISISDTPPPQNSSFREHQFPWALHRLLEDGTVRHIISWRPSGKSFRVHCKSSFERVILYERRFFKQTRYKSFARQLNLWGFATKKSGEEKGCYYHELFIRGSINLCYGMKRVKIKGSGGQARPVCNNMLDAISDSSFQTSEERIMPMTLSDIYENGNVMDAGYESRDSHNQESQETTHSAATFQPSYQAQMDTVASIGNDQDGIHNSANDPPAQVGRTTASQPSLVRMIQTQHLATFGALPWASEMQSLIHHEHRPLPCTTASNSLPIEANSKSLMYRDSTNTVSPSNDEPQRPTPPLPEDGVKIVNGQMTFGGVPLVPLRPNRPKENLLSSSNSKEGSEEKSSSASNYAKSIFQPITEEAVSQDYENHSPIPAWRTSLPAPVQLHLKTGLDESKLSQNSPVHNPSTGNVREQQFQLHPNAKSCSSQLSFRHHHSGDPHEVEIEHPQTMSRRPSADWGSVEFLQF